MTHEDERRVRARERSGRATPPSSSRTLLATVWPRALTAQRRPTSGNPAAASTDQTLEPFSFLCVGLLLCFSDKERIAALFGLVNELLLYRWFYSTSVFSEEIFTLPIRWSQ